VAKVRAQVSDETSKAQLAAASSNPTGDVYLVPSTGNPPAARLGCASTDLPTKVVVPGRE
jgi:hypothetical protein